MSKQKKVLLNLDADLYEKLAANATLIDLSVTEWLREAIRLKLKGPTPPAKPSLLDEPPFDPRPLAMTPEPAPEVAEQSIQSPDKPTVQYWVEQIKIWRGMPAGEGTAALLKTTGGVRPPAELFSSAERLAQWLMEFGK